MHIPKTTCLIVCLALSGCHYGERPASFQPAPRHVAAAPPKPAPPPAPPPKAAHAECHPPPETGVADLGTKVTVARQRIWFHPPAGWSYSSADGVVITSAPFSSALLGFTRAHGSRPKEILAALRPVFKQLHIKGVVSGWLKPRLDKPQSTTTADAEKLSMWEVNKRSQFGKAPKLDGKPGSLLIVLAPLSGGATLVGAGFVVDPGKKDLVTDILHAVQSLRSTE